MVRGESHDQFDVSRELQEMGILAENGAWFSQIHDHGWNKIGEFL